MSDYWRIFAEEVPSELGIALTEAQIESLAGMMEGAHENYGMAHGHDCISNPETMRADRAEKELKAERSKIQCLECGGKGSIHTNGPVHSYISGCWKCRGEGRHKP